MAEISELIRRLEVLEREGSVAALARLDSRVSDMQQKQEGHSTALVKMIELLEETRLRVSEVEGSVKALQGDLRELKVDIVGLRRDLPGIVADAVRDVMKGNQ